MFDLKFIRKNLPEIKIACQQKGVEVDFDKLMILDEKQRKYTQEIDFLRAEKNRITAIKNLADNDIETARDIKIKLKNLLLSLKKIKQEMALIQMMIPNLPLKDVPVGHSSLDNVIVRKVGQIPHFDFLPKDHLEIGEELDLIDIKRAAKVTGTGFVYLKNQAAWLELALIQLCFELFTKEGFTPIFPPMMIKEKPYLGMGRLTIFDKQERYYISKDKLYLIGSAEHTIGAMHMDEVLLAKNMPKRYVAFSSCFRREAGSYGKETKGMMRVHQFDKVEIFIFCRPEEADKEFNLLLFMQEKLMQALELPYQVVFLCTKEMGFIDVKQYDIETWLPSQNRYKETHSCSDVGDYQAKGINCRYKKEDGSLAFVNMLNATGCAIGRTIIAILENYQQKNGTVKVPKILQKYCGFKEIKKN